MNEDYVEKYNDYFEKVIYLKLLAYLEANKFFKFDKDDHTIKEPLNFQRIRTDFFIGRKLGGNIPIVDLWPKIQTDSDYRMCANWIRDDIEIMEIRRGLKDSLWRKIVDFLENIYDLEDNDIKVIDDIRNKLLVSDSYDAGELFHYFSIIGFLKERGLTKVVLKDEFCIFVENGKPFKTRQPFNYNSTGYGQYAFLMPDEGSAELLEMKRKLDNRNSTSISRKQINVLENSSNINELTTNLENIKKDNTIGIIDISSIFEDSHEKYSPSKIASDLIRTEYIVGQRLMYVLVSLGNVWNTIPLLEKIKSELQIWKEANPKSLKVIKIDGLLKDTVNS